MRLPGPAGPAGWPGSGWPSPAD